MDNNYSSGHDYFENHECKYYPCHRNEHINCLFCYCPLYGFENCLGNPRYISKGDRQIKVCTDCTFPHERENYPRIIEFLAQKNKKEAGNINE